LEEQNIIFELDRKMRPRVHPPARFPASAREKIEVTLNWFQGPGGFSVANPPMGGPFFPA
jgi:hypothetical protein